MLYYHYKYITRVFFLLILLSFLLHLAVKLQHDCLHFKVTEVGNFKCMVPSTAIGLLYCTLHW